MPGEDFEAELKMVLKGASRHFLFAPANDAAKSVLIVSKKAIPKSRRASAKKEAGAQKVYYGTCNKEDATLVFESPIQATKSLPLKLTQTIKKNSAIKPGAIEFRLDGNPVDGDETDDDAAAALKKLKSGVSGPLKAALSSGPPDVVEKLKKLAGAAAKREKADDVSGALEVFKGIATLLARSSGGNQGGAALGPALAGWQAARQKAAGQLTQLAKAIAATKDPEATDLIVMLKAVRANLTEEPDDAAKVAELERYLRTDEVVADAEEPNPWGFEVSLREPLLAALEPLRAAVG